MDVLPTISLIFGIIGFTGGAVGYFGKGRGDAIIKGQAELIDVRDRQLADKNSEIAALTAERDSLKEQNSTLKDLAQGSPQLVELTKQIKNLIGKIDKREK